MLGIGGYLFLTKKGGSDNDIQTPNTTTEQKTSYINNRLGYTFSLPKNYRVALDYTKFMNTTGPNPITNFADENAEFVLVTKNDRNEELRFLTGAQQAAKSEELFFAPSLAQTSLQNSIEIYPIPVSIDSIKELAGKMKDRGRKASSNFREVVLVSGMQATRFTEQNIGSDEILEVVYIPITALKYLRGGDKIEGITIKMNKRGEIFDNAAFEELVGSFKFIQ
ncbi:hypothetical protein HYW53_03590 [Candidatus Giovannonibacteria bacterium]|nr:hypothetical protein [Candidatus Giovannonibacteria bacterium]